MSYILDALKKSEQERGHGNAPGVQTVHSSSINYHNQKKSYWPYILITAVVLNFLAIVYFIIDKETPAIQEAPAIAEYSLRDDAKLTSQNHPIKETVQLDQASNLEKEPITKVTPVKVVATKQAAKRNTAAEPTSTSIINYHNLDDSIKAQLPAIIISAHVYSSNPTQRSIVINNNFLEEGEYIIDDLVLHEITPEGAILNYHGILFSYGAVSSWQ